MTPEGGSSSCDRALVTAFQCGDDQAFDEIFKLYHHRVAGVCSRMLRSPQDVEEATQETFMKAYQALGRFNGNYYLGAWLARIATNVCVDHLRSRSRSNLVGLPDDQDDIALEPGPEDLVVGDHPRLQRAIKEIQPLHASALALRAVEGLSHQEIAGLLRMTPSQVKALLHRARGSLRRAWDKAEGWVVAPLFGFRHLFDDRTTADAGRIVSASPSAAPFLLERVAASAMLMAAAFGGMSALPSGEPSTPEAPAEVAIAPPALEEKAAHDVAPIPGLSSSSPASGASQEASRKEGGDPLALAVQIKKALKNRSAPKPPAHDHDDDTDRPVGPSAAEGEKVVKKVEKKTEAVKDAVLP